MRSGCGLRRRPAQPVVARIACLAVLGMAVLAVLASPAAAAGGLEQAYKREFAFLEAEKHALSNRISRLQQQHAEKVAAARAEIEALQGRVMSKALQADRQQEALFESERQADTAGEGADVVESLLTQIDSTLEKGGMSLPAIDDDADYEKRLEQLQVGFEKSLPLLRKAGQLRRERGAYFSESGEKIEGELLHVGDVATFGLDPRAQGALSPAGAGRLQVWPEPGGKRTAAALASSSGPSTLDVFLYETLDKRVERRKEKSAREVVDSGGLIGWVIVGGGVLALVMALLRALLLMSSSSGTSRVMKRVAPLVEKKRFEEALAVAEKTRGALGRVLTTTLRHIERPRNELEDLIDEAVLHEQPALERFGNAIFVIAAVAPLLGLLGTVTGMIATFDIITEFGTGNPKLLSSGISIALVTTELGLIVAIPALLLGNFLNGWSDGIRDNLDRVALRVTNLAHGARLKERPTAGITPRVVSGVDSEALATS